MYSVEQSQFIEIQTELILHHITLLESTRGQVKSYIDELLNKHSWDLDKDVRINILHQINQVLTSHVMNLTFNVQQVSNHYFQIKNFKTNTFKDANRIDEGYYRFNKNGLIYNLSAIIERYLRLVAKELDHTLDVSKGIYGIKGRLFVILSISENSNEWSALELLSAIRNCIHNNGIYVNSSRNFPDQNVFYRDKHYLFVNNTPHDYATYENLNDIIDDFLNLIKIINANPTIDSRVSIIDGSLYL